MDYRREIDGLRALAVLPVILFHAGFQSFRGGFVGVDVFFVISGYLITTIILTELEQGRFSIINFYERRARRILPALFLVMFVCLPFAWLWLLPEDMKSFSQSLVAVSVFASNVLFWKKSGYFDTAAEFKPLLHTWSLAVEEQYYVFFPIFLVLSWRLGKSKICGLLAIVFVVSLAVAQWASLAEPEAGFYLLPTRGWELLVGVFIAFFVTSSPNVCIPTHIRDVGGFIGLALIVYAIFAFDKETPFPSLYTLAPTIGTALLIVCAMQGTIICRLLGNKILVGIGLVSYSSYLWHQPLLSFARHLSLGEPSKVLRGGLAALSLALGYLSWKCVELPFRNKNFVSRQAVVFCGLAGAFFFLFVGLAGHVFYERYKQIWLSTQTQEVRATFRVIEEAQGSLNYRQFVGKKRGDGECRFNVERLTTEIEEEILSCFKKHGKGVVILGDSHAIDLFSISLSSSQEPFLIGVTQIKCRPHSSEPQCQYEGFLSFVKKHPDVFTGVIYEQAGIYFLTQGNRSSTRKIFSEVPLDGSVTEVSVSERPVRAVYDYLTELSKYVKVVWVGARIEPHISPKTILNKGCAYPYALRTNQKEVFDGLDNFIENLVAGNSSIKFVSQQTLFNFEFPKDFMNCEQLFWVDGDHLSLSGIKNVASRFDLIALMKYLL